MRPRPRWPALPRVAGDRPGFGRHFGILLASLAAFSPFTHARESYESYFLYNTDASGGDFVDFEETAWANDDSDPNGIAHDDTNWYISAQKIDVLGKEDKTDWRLWRIPADLPLSQVRSTDPGVEVRELSDYGELSLLEYGHNGDLDYYPYRHGDQDGYLVLPLTSEAKEPVASCEVDADCTYSQECVRYVLPGSTGSVVGRCGCDSNDDHCPSEYRCSAESIILAVIDHRPVSAEHDTCVRRPALAFLDAPSLDYVGYAVLLDHAGVGWCTTPDFVPGEPGSPNRYVYTSNHDTDTIERYPINWADLSTFGPEAERDPVPFSLGQVLLDKDAASCDHELCSMQGGEFSPTGELLFLSSGILKGKVAGGVLGEEGDQYGSDGLHVFQTGEATWPEVARSSNLDRVSYPCCPAAPSFQYTFDNHLNVNVFWTTGAGHEPEGLTIWHGELYVLLMDWNWGAGGWGDDKAAIKRYSNRVYVDSAASAWDCSSECPDENPIRGTDADPYDKVRDAFELVKGWDGAEVMIMAGSYPETGTFNTDSAATGVDSKVRLRSRGGTVVIGR